MLFAIWNQLKIIFNRNFPVNELIVFTEKKINLAQGLFSIP